MSKTKTTGTYNHDRKPYKPRRWWEFWIAKPNHVVLDAETGSFFDAGRPAAELFELAVQLVNLVRKVTTKPTRGRLFHNIP